MLAALLVFAALSPAAQVSVPAVPQTFSAPLGLVIAGAPGSGKGTQGPLLAADLGLVHVSAGDLLRDYARANPEIAATMKRGELVPAALVVSLVRERLARADVRERGFVLDGFPRRLEEAGHLDAMRAEGLPIDAVIRLEVPEAELLRRVLARGRADDTKEVFDGRMKTYRDVTVPALEALGASAPIVAPDVTAGDPAQNYAQVRAALLAASPRARALAQRRTQ
jgi:adenylate kinase